MVPPRSSGRLPAPLNPASPRLRPRAPLAARVPRFALAPLVALVLLLVPGPALAQDAPAGEAGQHLAQAQQFVKNKWFDDAATEIEAALAAPGGMDSFEVAWTGAQIYYELAKMDRAATLAARAAAIAPEAGLRDRAAALRDYLTQSWGQLSVTAPYPGMTSRLQVDGGPGLLDADARRLVNRITLSLRDNTPLPVTVFLPVGTWQVNGKTVEVVAGQPAVVELGVKELGARGLAALQVSRLEVGAGTVLVLGGPVSHLRPGGTLELAFTQPLGPVLLGVVADWDLRTWSTPTGGAVFDPLAVSGGLRLGRELAVSGPLALRPSLGVRAGFEPGIGLACRYEEGDLSAVACGPGWGGDVVDTQVHVFVDATTVSPFAELAVEYRQGGRTTALGVGVKLGLEEQILLLPSEGEAQVSTGADGSGATIRYSSDVSTATATGIRLAAVADFAF